MPKLELTDSLRYMMGGFVLLIYLYIWDQTQAAQIVETFGAVGLVGISVAIGALSYLVYRAFPYKFLIAWIQDKFRKGNNHSYRTYLTGKFSLNREQARNLFVQLRDNNSELKDAISAKATIYAIVHYGYQSSLFGFSFYLTALLFDRDEIANIYLIIATIIFIAAFFVDRELDSEEYQALISLGDSKIQEAKNRMLETTE